MAPRKKRMRGKLVSLTGEEREAVWSLCYNVLSQGGSWPVGLDTPNNIPGTLQEIERVMDKLAPDNA